MGTWVQTQGSRKKENETVNRCKYVGRLVLGLWLIVTGLLLVVTIPNPPRDEPDE
jgi:endonuclease YncB( thermonuclease family)